MNITAESSQQNLLNQLEALVLASRKMLEFMSGAKSGVEAALAAALKELEQKTYTLKNDLMVSAYDYEREGAPSADVNPKGRNAKWLDLTTGAVWVCRDNTPDQNIWISSQDIRGALQTMESTLNSMRENLNAQSDSNAKTLKAQIEAINALMDKMQGDLNQKMQEVRAFDYTEMCNPSGNTNPSKMGAIWLNQHTSVLFTCVDNTADANKSVNYATSSHLLRTYNADNGSHGADYYLKCRHNVDGNDRFKLQIVRSDGSPTHSTSVDYANTAGKADNISMSFSNGVLTITYNS